MLYVVLHRLNSVAKAWSPGAPATRLRRLASVAVLLTCSWVAVPVAMAQRTVVPAPSSAAPAASDTAAASASSATPATVAPQAAPANGATDVQPASPPGTAADAAAPVVSDTPGNEAGTPPDTRGLDQEVQGLKKDVVDLNRELFVLEEELLFPANTQVAVFVSMDVGDFFALDTVTLKIDQKEVINYLYTPREVEALLKGGVHRLYLGNLKVGKHELVAFFSGKGPNDRDYKRGATLKFEKGIGAKYLELKINDRQRRQQPEFEIKDWE
jgi:hypothetical protein